MTPSAPVTVRQVTNDVRKRAMPGVAALEAIASYPLGEDRFRLDHGEDYFAFFERLGELWFYAGWADEAPVAVGAGVLRAVPMRAGEAPRPAWYLCDLKVHPDFRGRHLPLRLLSACGFWRHYRRAPRFYMISMNPPDGAPNPVLRLFRHFPRAAIRLEKVLGLYTFDMATALALQPVIEAHRGPVSYLSLEWVKDLVLESTHARMPLLHAQFGPCAAPMGHAPQPGHVHMLAAPLDSPLARALAAHGQQPSATASVLAHGMADCDWAFVLTSDI